MSLIAAALVCLGVACYTGQTFFNKLYSVSYTGPDSATTPVFAGIYGLFTGFVTLVCSGFRFHPSAATLGFGLMNGVVLFVFNLSAIRAARSGPYAFQSLLMLFGNILLPLGFSTLFWGDALSGLKILGILVMLLSFVLFNLKGLNVTGAKKGYFFWVAMLFLTNGLYGVVMDAQQRIALQTQRSEMIITTFAVSAVISLVYLFVSQKKAFSSAFVMKKKTWGFLFGSSICAAAAVNTMMVTLAYVPASVLYTVQNGGVLVMSALLSAVVLKEKITRPMSVGIALAIASLVLLSA